LEANDFVKIEKPQSVTFISIRTRKKSVFNISSISTNNIIILFIALFSPHTVARKFFISFLFSHYMQVKKEKENLIIFVLCVENHIKRAFVESTWSEWRRERRQEKAVKT
jgi:hypothetical protein